MKCKAVQMSDQMHCECGAVWDVNDASAPHCRNVAARDEFTRKAAGDDALFGILIAVLGLYLLIEQHRWLAGSLMLILGSLYVALRTWHVVRMNREREDAVRALNNGPIRFSTPPCDLCSAPAECYWSLENPAP